MFKLDEDRYEWSDGQRFGSEVLALCEGEGVPSRNGRRTRSNPSGIDPDEAPRYRCRRTSPGLGDVARKLMGRVQKAISANAPRRQKDPKHHLFPNSARSDLV